MRIHVCASLLLSCVFAVTARECQANERAGSVDALPAPFLSDEFKKHAEYLASDELAGRAPGGEGSANAAKYVIRHFEEYGLKPLRDDGSWFQEFPLVDPDPTTGSVTGKNILAVLPGRGDLSREAIIVCAHYDHIGKTSARREEDDTIYNGANDNASGVAALLLVAKAAAGEKSPPSSHRTVLFISFDAEEQGLQGAKFYASRPAWPLERTAAVINFDAMGRMRLEKFFTSDVETNPILAEAVREAAKQRQLITETNFGGHGRSDHAVFLERGIPGMHFFTGANSDYHQVTDHSDKLNFEGGADIAWIGHQVLQKAMTHSGRLEFRKLDPTTDVSFLLNLVQTLGIIPNVNDQEGRYPQILLVIPNSPAAKHGLKSGDQITSVNGLVFNRVEDGLTIFPQLTLEDGVQISVLRGEEKADISIPGSVFEKLSGPTAKRLPSGKYLLQFRYKAAPGVKSVYLAGDFNDWKPSALRMEGPDASGQFATRLELEAGTYQYKFVVEGKEWKTDPENVYKVGPENNSLLRVGPPRKAAN